MNVINTSGKKSSPVKKQPFNIFKDKSLHHKLISAFLFVAITPVLLTLTISFISFSSTVEKQAYNQLAAVREIKKQAIKRYFSTIEDQVILMSSDTAIVDAMQGFKSSFFTFQNQAQNYIPTNYKDKLSEYYNHQFGIEYESQNGKPANTSFLLKELNDNSAALQYQYIQNNPNPLGNKHLLNKSTDSSEYSLLHASIHPQISNFLERFGYYDIFLVEPDNGYIVYSVYKELDFATSLLDGAYKQTNIAKAFDAAKKLTDSNQAILIDYASYLPSYNAPASFIASPIYHNNSLIGVLIFQMPIDAINTVMLERTGLGETGETYLVGEDNLMRSDSYLEPDTHSVVNSFRKPHNGSVDTKASNNAIAGQTGTEIINDYLGNSVLSAYTPINILGLKWALIAEIDENEAFKAIEEMTYIIFGTLLGILLVIIILTKKFSSTLIQPIRKLVNCINQVEREGDFSIRCDDLGKDEIGQVGLAFNQLLQQLQKSIHATNQVMHKMAEGEFSSRINVDSKGELHTLNQSVNHCADTLEQAISDVNNIVADMSQGNFTSRIQSSLKGDLLLLKENINQSVENLDISINDIIQVVAAINNGDFTKTINCQVDGQLQELKDHVNNSVNNLDNAITEICGIMGDIRKGDFTNRVNTPLKGQLHILKTDINQSLDNLNTVMTDISDVMEGVKTGDFTKTINCNADGQLKELKNNINSSIKNLAAAISAISDIMEDVRKGIFTNQINLPLEGQLDLLKSDINQSINNLNTVTSDITSVMGAFKGGDFSQVIQCQAEGQLGELKKHINSSVNNLNETISEVCMIMGEIRHGNFKDRITLPLQGQLGFLKSDINQSLDNLTTVMRDITAVMNSFKQGDFSHRINDHSSHKTDNKQTVYQGELLTLKEASNHCAESLEHALSAVSNVLTDMSHGNFSQRVNLDLQGELNTLKNNINHTVTSIDNATQEIATVMSATRQGNLSQRISSHFDGQLGSMKDDINASLDNTETALNDVMRVLNALAQGDLTSSIQNSYLGAFDTLKQDVNATISQLTNSLRGIIESANNVSSGAQEIATSNKDMSIRTEEQAARLEEASHSMQQLLDTTSKTESLTKEAVSSSTLAEDAAKEGGNASHKTAETIKDVHAASEEINAIIEVIDAITFQTNLLALNAAVEAARAGNHGRGFAVVASEVRALAGRSAEAAKQIRDIIRNTTQKINTSSELATSAGEKLMGIVSSVTEVSQSITSINLATEEQNRTITEMEEQVRCLSDVTNANAAMVEETASAANSMASQANTMHQLISHFKLGDQHSNGTNHSVITNPEQEKSRYTTSSDSSSNLQVTSFSTSTVNIDDSAGIENFDGTHTRAPEQHNDKNPNYNA